MSGADTRICTLLKVIRHPFRQHRRLSVRANASRPAFPLWGELMIRFSPARDLKEGGRPELGVTPKGEPLSTSLPMCARESAAMWKDDHNTIRPHSALGNLPPAVFAKISAPGMQWRSATWRAPLRAAPRCPTGQHRSNEARNSPHRRETRAQLNEKDT